MTKLVKFNVKSNFKDVSDENYDEWQTIHKLRRTDFKKFKEKLELEMAGGEYEVVFAEKNQEVEVPNWYYEARKNDTLKVPNSFDRFRGKDGKITPAKGDELKRHGLMKDPANELMKIIHRFDLIADYGDKTKQEFEEKKTAKVSKSA